MLDVRTAQTQIEIALRDAILYALGHRLASVASIAALRAVPTAGASSTRRHDDDLIPIVVSGLVTAHYRWSSASTASDNGTTVIKPTDVAGSGRWIQWTSQLRLAPNVGGNSYLLHELATGPLRRVIVLDKSMTEEEVNQLIVGQVPSVVIEATDDSPEPAELGYRYLSEYEFTISCITENLRDRRQAAQGSGLSIDVDPGANTLDGLVMALLGGTQLSLGTGLSVGDVTGVIPGRGHNWMSDLGQRRVVRSRTYTIRATAIYPGGANDLGPIDEIDAQPRMTDLHGLAQFDDTNYLATPYFDLLGGALDFTAGLAQTIYGGNAVVGGTPITVSNASHTFTADRDTYRDLNPNGTWTFVVTGRGMDQPAVTVGAMRVGVTTTNGTDVVSDYLLAATNWDLGNPWVYSI